MSTTEPGPKAVKSMSLAANVLQVERRDFTELAPTGRARSQSLEGFDEVYTDIVDYIVRCTHRIWDERDIGLIYTHYTHNAVIYGNLGAVYNREDIVKSTLQQLAAFPDRRAMANSVIWKGDDKEGFYTSHLVTSMGRYNQNGYYGPASGRSFTSRIIADCMILENKIYREWVVGDNLTVIRQLGLDPQLLAHLQAQSLLQKGVDVVDIGENRRLLGQNPPETTADLSLAATDLERHTLEWLHEVYNKRMFGRIAQVFAPSAMYHGPRMKELYGSASVLHQYLGFMAVLPDAAFMPQHICSTDSEEGGTKVAVRWVLEGHHQGHGILSELKNPSGQRIQMMGMTHYHYKNGKVVDEWTVYDEFAALVQVKLGKLVDGSLMPLQGSEEFDLPID